MPNIMFALKSAVRMLLACPLICYIYSKYVLTVIQNTINNSHIRLRV